MFKTELIILNFLRKIIFWKIVSKLGSAALHCAVLGSFSVYYICENF